MKNKGFIFCIIISSLVMNSCFSDLGCIFEFPENKNELRVMEIMYSDSFLEAQVLRKNIFIGDGNNIPYDFEFISIYYSFDGRTSYFRNGKKGFINYGADITVYSEPMLISHPPFLSYNSGPHKSDFDYQRSSNTSIYHDYKSYEVENPFTGDTVYTTLEFLYQFDHLTESSELLQSYKPVFLDSMTYKITSIFDQRYTPDNEIFVVAGDVTWDIHYNEEYDFYFGIPQSSQEHFLLKLKEDLSFDTLITAVEGEGRPQPFISKNRTLLTIGKNTYQFNKLNGSIKFLYEGNVPQNMAIDEQSLTFHKGTKYYSFLKDKVIDLSDYFDDIKFSIPYKNLVAVQIYSEKDKLYVIDLNKKSIIKTISSHELPEFKEVSGSSFFRIENPVFTTDGDLIFMHIRQTYLEDEEFEKRCG